MKKRVPSKYVYKLYTLPEKLNNDILALNLCSTQYDRVIRFMGVLKRKSYQQNRDYCLPVTLPRDYLTTFLTTGYHKITNMLVEKGIIERDDYWNQKKSICKKYNISPKYFERDLSILDNINIENREEIKGIKTVNLSLKCVFVKDDVETERVIDSTKKQLNRLNIDGKRLREVSEELVENISENDFILNSNITEPQFEVKMMVNSEFKSRWVNLKDAQDLAKLNGKDLIQDKKCFYIMRIADFITRKKDMVRIYHNESIGRLEKKYWTVSRNSTNNRLDTNLTNLPTGLVKVIMEDNDLVQVDLSNSQFAILASLLPENLVHPSTVEFKESASSGKFYESVQKKLDLDTRNVAKQTTFELLFSSHKNKSNNLTKMREAYPELMNYIDDYKIENGHKNFSISLQKEESRIFIDGILNRLSFLKIPSLSKHDSIICKQSDFEEVLDVINSIFSLNNFKGNLVY